MIERGHLKLVKSSRDIAPAAPQASGTGEGEPTLDRRRVVLVIEPDATLATSIAEELGERGFRVILTRPIDFEQGKAGDQAMAIVRREHIDALVLEFDIQDLRGDVFFELASAYQPHLRSAAVFILAKVNESVLQLLRACNCQWLRKPFDLNSLATTIERFTS